MGGGELTLCGFGLFLSEMTPQTRKALEEADVVFTDSLDEASLAELRGFCREVRDLKGEPSYERMAGAVLDAAAQGRRTAVLKFGHPAFFADLSRVLLKACRERGVPCRLLNAVSSFDALLAQLELTTFGSGVQLFDACEFAARPQAPISPEIPAFFIKAGYLAREGLSGAFLERLRGLYPAAHPAELVECPSLRRPGGSRRGLTLQGLEDALREVNEFNTLYLPAAARPEPPASKPGDAEALLRLGERLLERRNLAGAERLFDLALELEPESAAALSWKARLLLDRGQDAEAAALLERCVELHPKPGWHHLLRGELRVRSGKPREALEDLALAGSKSRDAAWICALKMSALAQLEDYAAAVREAAEAAGAGLEPAWALLERQPRPRLEGLVRALEERLAAEPKPLLRFLSGSLLLALGESARAAERLREVSDGEMSPFILLRLGEALLKAGEFEEAARVLEESIELGGADAWAFALRGEALGRLGRGPESRVDFRKALALDARDVLKDFPSVSWRFRLFLLRRRLGWD